MDLFRIGQYTGIQSSMNIREIKTVDLQTVKKQDALKDVQNQETSSVLPASYEAEQSKAKRVANLQDISLNFRRNDEYGYIGKDADVKNLDMEKAISDMQKDSLLHEYQYFIGSTENFFGKDTAGSLIQSISEDGVVLIK